MAFILESLVLFIFMRLSSLWLLLGLWTWLRLRLCLLRPLLGLWLRLLPLLRLRLKPLLLLRLWTLWLRFNPGRLPLLRLLAAVIRLIKSLRFWWWGAGRQPVVATVVVIISWPLLTIVVLRLVPLASIRATILPLHSLSEFRLSAGITI